MSIAVAPSFHPKLRVQIATVVSPDLQQLDASNKEDRLWKGRGGGVEGKGVEKVHCPSYHSQDHCGQSHRTSSIHTGPQLNQAVDLQAQPLSLLYGAQEQASGRHTVKHKKPLSPAQLFAQDIMSNYVCTGYLHLQLAKAVALHSGRLTGELQIMHTYHRLCP